MAGDQFSIRVSSWYNLNGSAPSAPANPLPDLLSALISGVGGLPAGGHPTATQLGANSSLLSSNLTNFLSDTGSTIVQTRPHAFVNWVLFDNQFNFVASSSGFDQVGTDQEFHHHTLTNLPIDKSGYLYIYLSDETQNIPVYFDNFQVTHVRGPMLEEDHYYPFGLTMEGISDRALKRNYAENEHKFVGQLLDEDLGWDVYQFRFRNHDPQIGRFLQVDPLASKYVYSTPYAYAENNPATGIDLEGKEFFPAVLAFASGNGAMGQLYLANALTNFNIRTNDALGAMNRIGTNTSDQSSMPGSGPIQNATASANNIMDHAKAVQPIIDH
ncbi:MAG: RHS repeat-associated core domain-containing protein [Bacteroidota bacterium]|nr:RHS repeat-associated core domain-containing protein [Bacteroidota bacterium]